MGHLLLHGLDHWRLVLWLWYVYHGVDQPEETDSSEILSITLVFRA